METIIVLAALLLPVIAVGAVGCGVILMVVGLLRGRRSPSEDTEPEAQIPLEVSSESTIVPVKQPPSPTGPRKPQWRAPLRSMRREPWKPPSEVTGDLAPERSDYSAEDLQATMAMGRIVRPTSEEAKTPQEEPRRDDDATEESDPRPSVVGDTVPPLPWSVLFRRTDADD